jgi:plastocyanin
MTPRNRVTRATAALIAAIFAAACSSGDGGTIGPNQDVGTVSGTVTEQGAGGVAGVSVRLSRSGFSNRNATTGSNGAYTFSGVETGAWTVTVTAPPGFNLSGSATATVTVATNQTATVPAIVLVRVPAGLQAAVDMGDNFFSPQTARVLRGGMVTWTNRGATAHNTTSNQAGLWQSGNLNPQGTFSRTFPTAGTFEYSCTLHAGMNGTVIVE